MQINYFKNFQLTFTLKLNFYACSPKKTCFGVAVHHYVFSFGAVIAVVH